jgi:hypothetical protein
VGVLLTIGRFSLSDLGLRCCPGCPAPPEEVGRWEPLRSGQATRLPGAD